jgi:hypothetical protein
LFHDDSKGNHGRTLADVASAATDFFTHESAGGEDTWKQIASSEFGSADNARVEFVEMLGNPEALSATRSIGEKLLALC